MINARKNFSRRKGRLADNDTKQAVLQALPPFYYEAAFDPVRHELAALTKGFHPDRLEEVIETRMSMLEVMTEMLAAHVVAHYDKFSQGMATIAVFEGELGMAVNLVKAAKQGLRKDLAVVEAAYNVVTRTAFKGQLLQLLDYLVTLRSVRDLPNSLRGLQYGASFELCAQAWNTLATLPKGLATQFTMTKVRSQYDSLASSLDESTRQACLDFAADDYVNVLEGHMFVGTLRVLGSALSSHFGDLLASQTLGAVHRAAATARPPVDLRHVSNMHEAARTLPPHLLWSALSKMSEAIVDLLVSQQKMTRWHIVAIHCHQQDLSHLQEAAAEARLESAGQTPIQNQGPDLVAVSQDLDAPCQSAAKDVRPQVSLTDSKSAGGGADTDGATTVPDTGNASTAVSLAVPAIVPPSVPTPAKPDSALEGAEAAVAAEAAWGDALVLIHAGLCTGRRFIWEEASRKIGIIALSTAAMRPENLHQVLGCVTDLLKIGEAFSGDDSRQLRAALSTAAQTSFAQIHAAAVQRQAAALARESWRSADVSPSGLPDLAAALSGISRMPVCSGTVTLQALLSDGNPWRSKTRAPSVISAVAAETANAACDTATVALQSLTASRQHTTDPAANLSDYGASLLVPQPTPLQSIAADWGGGPGHTQPSLQLEVAKEKPQHITTDAAHLCAQNHSAMTPGRPITTVDAVSSLHIASTAVQLLVRMRDYCHLMRVMHTGADVFKGFCELFELFLLHTFAVFSATNLGDLLSERAPLQGSAEDAVSLRLRRTLHRICTKENSGLESVRGQYMRGTFAGRRTTTVMNQGYTTGHQAADRSALPSSPECSIVPGESAMQSSVASPVAKQLAGRDPSKSRLMSTLNPKNVGFEAALSRIVHSDGIEQMQALGGKLDTKVATAAGAFSGVGASLVAGVERSARSAGSMMASLSAPSSGNWSLVEKAVAAESVVLAAAVVKKAGKGLTTLPPEHVPALDAFIGRTVDTSVDVRDAILRAAARSVIQLDNIRAGIVASDYGVREVPLGPSLWVADAVREIDAFSARLVAAAVSLSSDSVSQLWHHAAAYLAEALVDGLSSISSRCTPQGRGAMAVDVAEVAAAAVAASRRSSPSVPVVLQSNMAMVQAWIKAFYIETDAELVKWVAIHPEYTRAAVLALVTAVAEYRGLSRAKRQALIEAANAAAAPVASM